MRCVCGGGGRMTSCVAVPTNKIIIDQGLVLDTALWSALPADVDGALEKTGSSQPDSTFFGSVRDKDPVLVQLQPVGFEVVQESENLFWNTQGDPGSNPIQILQRNFFKWAILGLFLFIFVITNITILTTNICEKCYDHPVYGARIRIHDLQNMSVLP